MVTCDFQKGETLYCIGLNMQCKNVVVKVKFVEMHDDGRVVTESGGIKVIGGPITDYFKTKEDCRKVLK